MCRLFAFASRTPCTVSEAMGADNVVEFADLSRLHEDGWGAAWLHDAGVDDSGDGQLSADAPEGSAAADSLGRVARLRSTRPAFEDPLFGRVVHGEPSTAALVHLRWASPGIPVELVNQHPFLAKDPAIADVARGADGADAVAFAHNGGVDWTDELANEGRRAWERTGQAAPAWEGTCDSERYFWLVRAYRAAGVTWPEAVTQAHDTIRAHTTGCVLNGLLLTPSYLVAVHSANGRHADFTGADLRGFADTGLPRDHADAYYRLGLRREADQVAIVSSGLPTQGWEAVPDQTMIVIDLATLDVTTVPLPWTA